MANINIRIDDKLEIELKKRAKESGYKTLSDYIRSILKENHQEEQLSRPTIEAEIEKLEEAQKEFSDLQERLINTYIRDSKFLTMFMYHFLAEAMEDESVAKKAWEKAKMDSEG
jgi:Zn-dependent M32 family carboxypeptidase